MHLVIYHMPWCPHCRALRARLDAQQLKDAVPGLQKVVWVDLTVPANERRRKRVRGAPERVTHVPHIVVTNDRQTKVLAIYQKGDMTAWLRGLKSPTGSTLLGAEA